MPVASVVAERVVARPAEAAAVGAVVVGVALHADAVREAQSARSLVRQRVPVGARVQQSGVDGPLDLPTCKTNVERLIDR